MKTAIHLERPRDLSAEDRNLIAGVCSAALLRSRAFARRRMWPLAVVVIEPDVPPRVTSRADFTAWLRANDLHALAEQLRRVRVRDGEIVAYIVDDNDVGLFVFDLSEVLR